MSDSKKSDCTPVAEMLGAFRDMELSLEEAEMVEAHLSVCPACRLELEEIEKIVATLQSLPEVPVRDFAYAIEARINQKLAQAVVEKEPTLALVPNNVHALPPRRAAPFSVWAAAAILLGGLIAATTLAPRQASEVAQSNDPVQNARAASVAYDAARHVSRTASKKAGPQAEDLVALYDEESASNATDVGISTNEDGLYAIKM